MERLLNEKLPASLQGRLMSWTADVLLEVDGGKHFWDPSDMV